MGESQRQPRFLARLLRAYSSGLKAGGYPDSYSGVTSGIADSPLDRGAPYDDPETDHNQLRLAPDHQPRSS